MDTSLAMLSVEAVLLGRPRGIAPLRAATGWTWSAMSDLICTFSNSLSLSLSVSLSHQRPSWD